MYIPIRHSPPSSIVTMFRGQLNHTGCPEVQRNLSLAWVDRSGDYRYRVKQKQSSQVLGLAGYNVATTWWSFGVDSRTFEGDSRNLAEQFFTQLCTQQCIMKLPEGTSSSVQRKAAVAPVLKRIMFRTNIRRNSSDEYSAETDVSKIGRIRLFGFRRIFGILPNI